MSRRSMTFRLTLLISVAATAILLLLGILVGTAVERHFRHHDMEMLEGKMTLATHAIENAATGDAMAAISRQLGDALVGHADIEIQVKQADDTTIFASEHANFPNHLLARQPASVDLSAVSWRTESGRLYLGIARDVRSPAKPDTAFQVMVATDITHQDSFMRAFRRTLWSAVALAMFLTGVATWYVVRREMQPLQAIRQEASGITARRLDQRLSSAAVPAELEPLVDTLNEMLARLERSFQRLTEFSSDLAHELRTPLSNLLTQTQVTLTKARSPGEYREVLASNAEELERLSRMVSDMLFLAQADHAMVIPTREPVDLASETQAVLDFYEALASEKHIALSLAGTSSMSGDRLMLRRALSNLLSNAIRHTPEGGAIKVVLSSAEQAVQISVSNTGDPIPAELHTRLFDRFYRVDASRERMGQGAGLGLAITDSIVRAHGGEIKLCSDGDMTKFTLIFPQLDNALAAS
jgi:two-component system, OmpR family, heavy metal sensor histidine kinase CusS